MTMTNNAVAEKFASGATEGDAHNMYIRGDTIYSYGSHFPIAKRIPGGYIFNSNTYSVSTGKHKSTVGNHIHKDILWELPGCCLDEAVEDYTARALKAIKKIPGSRRWFSSYLETLEFNISKAIEASEKLCQDLQPLYGVLNTDIAAEAMKRIEKEGEIPEVMVEVFIKARFLGQNNARPWLYIPG